MNTSSSVTKPPTFEVTVVLIVLYDVVTDVAAAVTVLHTFLGFKH